MKPKVLYSLLFIINSILPAQTQIQTLVSRGAEQVYNLDLISAEKTYNKILELRPNSPLGYYYLARIHFWIYLGSRDPGEYQTFIKFADIAQEKIDETLTKNKKDYQTKFLAGNLASYRAMAQATNNSSVDAFWSCKKAAAYFEETIELNPKDYDAYLGLGLLDYAMSFVPDFLKWAVSLTGLNSDKERGFRYIKTAFKKGTDKTEAAFHLAKIYTDYIAEYDSAFALLENLTSRFPNNSLFLYQYGVSLIKDRQLDRASIVLDRVIKLKNKKLPQITALANYRKGEIFFKKNQFQNAINFYERFLDTSKELDFIGFAALNTALCYKFLGKQEEFLQYLQQAKGGNQDIFEDSYAKEKSEKYLNTGISLEELKLIRMKNYLDAGRYKVVYDSLKLNLEHILKPEDKAMANLYFAEAALNLNKYTEAIYTADQIEKLDISSEKFTEPMALLIKAKAKYLLREKEEAKGILEKAEDKNDYEFKDYIQAQIEWLKRRLPR